MSKLRTLLVLGVIYSARAKSYNWQLSMVCIRQISSVNSAIVVELLRDRAERAMSHL